MEDIDTVVKKAAALMAEIRQERERCESEDDLMKLLEFVQMRDKDFAVSFPMVLRIMVLQGEFSAKGFRRFCRAIRSKPMRGHAEYIALQVSYMAFLWRAQHPHGDERELRRLRASWGDQLEREKEEFENKFAAAEKEVDATFAKAAGERRESLVRLTEEALRDARAAPAADAAPDPDLDTYDVVDAPASDSDSDAPGSDAPGSDAEREPGYDPRSVLELLRELQEAEREIFGESYVALRGPGADEPGADDEPPPLEGADDDEPPPLEGADDEPPEGRAPPPPMSEAASALLERLESFEENERRKTDLGMNMQPAMQISTALKESRAS